MNVSVFAYSRRGCQTARTILKFFQQDQIEAYTMERFQEPDFLPLGKPTHDFYGHLFGTADAMIFVGSCGIAVREIAPHVHDKRTDPAVLCVDELGQYVIPLLSGHIGGANELAAKLAEQLHAQAIITTATDINRKFSVDAWAARNGFAISSMPLAKAVSAAILEHEIPLCSAFPIGTQLPPGVVAENDGELGIALTWNQSGPFEKTLRLIPKVLHLGIGCRRGTEQSAIEAAVQSVLNEYQIDERAVKCAASIDLKADEQGLLAFCESCQWPISFYSAQELQQVEGAFTPSAFVKSVTGVENVCERSALLGAERLIVKKTALNGVTVAVAVEKLEVHFG